MKKIRLSVAKLGIPILVFSLVTPHPGFAGNRAREMRSARAAAAAAVTRSQTVTRTGSRCGRLLSKMADWASLGAIGIFAGSIAAPEIVGYATQSPYLGLSTYLDMDNVRGSLSPKEQALLDDPKKNRNAIIDLFVARLSRQYDDKEFLPFLRPQLASEYLQDDGLHNKGVCLNKALVLNGILNALGIRAELHTGMVRDDRGSAGHAWVYLPETGEIADPTWGFRLPVDQVKTKYEIQGEIPFAVFMTKLVGGLVR